MYFGFPSGLALMILSATSMSKTPASFLCRIHVLVVCGVSLFATAGVSLAAEMPPGKSTFGEGNYIEYIAGDLPLIICAPHGGREVPEEFPDRTRGVIQIDTNTQELARAVAAEITSRTGHYPHVIICRLARKKLDCNREIGEAAAGHPAAERAWGEYHAFIEKACAAAVAKSGKGFLLDLHGQSHKDQRIELGYLHSIETLALPDAALNAPGVAAAGSLRLVAASSKLPYAQLLRGPQSLGGLIEAQGYRAAPSPSLPSPVLPFFIGGYTVARHTRAPSKIAGLQIESNLVGVRDTAAAREKFARALVSALGEFLAGQFAMPLVVRPASGRR